MVNLVFKKSALWAILIATVLALGACGGGGSSSGSGAGGSTGLASISGSVNDGVSLNESDQNSFIASLIRIAIQNAHATGVAGVEVQLLLGGAQVSSQTTNGSGEFRFNGLVPGNYTVRITPNGQVMDTAVSLSADTNTRLDLNTSGGVLNLEVEAANGVISGEVEDDTSDDSSDDTSDDISEDDMSSDDDSSDDESSDDISEDDLSDDDSSDDDSSDVS